MFVEGYAQWRPTIVSDDNEKIGQDIHKIELPCCEYQPQSNKVTSYNKLEANGATLGLRTNDMRAKDIVQDDEITWKGNTYSVDLVQAVRSAAFLGAREYVIWLH